LRSDVLETIFNPERIFLGGVGELIDIRKMKSDKHLVVIYREQAEDGFIITAFLTNKARTLAKRRQIWP
jgi:hypothetical protein